jgi:hypothetical protein
MIFIRRDGRGPDRFTWVRGGLFFFAAGLWLAGALTDRPVVTGVAIGVLLLAMLLRLAGRAGGE